MSNKGFLKLSLLDVQGRKATDPDTQVDVVRLEGGATTILRFNNINFRTARRMELPAFPQARNLVCEVTPRRYRPCKTDIISLTDGEERPYGLRVLRDPKAWRAQFTPWDQLSTQFEDLKRVLGNSVVKLIKGESLGQFTEKKYDQVNEEHTVMAKATLLNLFAKLTLTLEPIGGRNHWFSFIDRILAIDRERFYAVVDLEMGEIIREILRNPNRPDHYERSDPGLHFENLRETLPDFTIRRDEMFSVKTDERHANLQLTVAPARDAAGNDVMLLDADIDENGDLLNHLIDVILIHPVNGGTHPFDIHEYLLRSHANLQLGYELV